MSGSQASSASEFRTTAGYAAGVVAIALLIMLVLKSTSQEVDFCRRIFKGFVKGNVTIEKQIDWEHLQAVGTDVGKEYRLFRLEKDRVDYKNNFILAFAQAFRLSGGSFNSFVKWRVIDRKPEVITVAADYPLKDKTLLFDISASGKERKLLGLRWSDQQEVLAPATTEPAAQPQPEAKPCCEASEQPAETHD